MNISDDIDLQRHNALRGERARKILESELWIEAWKTYEGRILEEFINCKSDDVSRMQQLKMLHLAGVAAQKHLEAILVDGKFAAKDLEFKEQRGVLRFFKK